MAHSPVVWAFKDLVTSAKLAQMVENTKVHDHRADGTQGDPFGHLLSPAWTSAAVNPSANVSAGLGTFTLPALKRPATLFLVVVFTPAATAGQLVLVPTLANDARIVNLGSMRSSWPAISATYMSTYALPVAEGAAGAAVPVAATSTVAGTGLRCAAWLQG